MITKKATIIISICAGAAVIAGGLFGIYKHFVTPDKIVALSLINAINDAEKTFEYFDDDEKEIFADFLKDGGKTEADFTVSDSAVLNGMSFSVKSNSDGNCTVSEIGLKNGMTLEAYKDRERIYVNMPIFSGGFEIPVADFAEKWNSSIFKDIVTIPEGYTIGGIAAGFVTGKYSMDDFADAYGKRIKNEVYDLIKNNPIKKNGSAVVTVENKRKRAKVYTLKIDRASAETLLIDIAADYISYADGSNGTEAADKLQTMFAGYADDYELSFMVDGMTLREIELKNSANDSWTAAFEGKGNPFDIIVCFKNNDVQNAIRRVHNSSSGKLSENIYFGESGSFSFEETKSMLNAKLFLNDWDMSFNAYGKTVTDDKISYDNAELDIDGICALSGSFSVSDEYDRDFSFNKSGQYVNLLEIGQDEWEAVTGKI
ncbi:MAG: hypothetical protein ACI38A_06060, partial [Candidatus Ornithomonoglobus sp.]